MTNDDPARDPRLSAAWREHSSELPSAQLDATILAAAHRAVGSVPQSAGTDARDVATPARAATRPQRWWMPLAAAATIGAVALGILQTAPPDQIEVAQSSSDPRSTSDTRSTPDTRSTSPLAPSAAPSREKAVVAPEMAAPAEPFPAPRKQDAKERKDSSIGERGAAAPANAQREAPPPAAAPRTMQPATPSDAPSGPASTQSGPASAPAPAVAAGNVAAQRTETDAAQSRPAVAAAPQPFPAEKKNEVADAIAPQQQYSDAFAQQKQRAAEAPAPARMAAASDESRQRSAAASPPQPAAASPPPPPSTAAASAPSSAALSKTTSAAPASGKVIDIDAAIVRIRRLHDDGKLADAAKELNALRATVPDADARLPPELRAWAATVKQ